MSTIFNSIDEWTNYARKAWMAAGSPAGLDPAFIFTQPISYTFSTYKWFEEHYSDVYDCLYHEIEPDSNFMKEQPDYFVERWVTHFDPITVWKQLLPLFVFGKALGGLDHRHMDLAKAYTIGKAIPSMVVDQMLDNPVHQNQNWQDDWLFCLTAYALGIELIRKSDKASNGFEDIFLHYTREMYLKMWKEKHVKFQLPEYVSSETLTKYINGDSRLLSSVFFGTTIELAFLLANQPLPSQFPSALLSLRKVRQLNDELADLDDDILGGLVTFPYLHCLASKQWSQALSKNIRETWQISSEPPNPAKLASLRAERRAFLQQAGSCEVTALASVQLLSVAMEAVMIFFSMTGSFEITLLLNQRLSHLSRLEQNDWQEMLNIYQPVTSSFNRNEKS